MTLRYTDLLPIVDERDDVSYLDFVEGARGYLQTKINASLKERGNAALSGFERDHGRPVAGLEEAKALLNPLPIMGTRHRWYLQIQQMMWNGSLDGLRRHEAELIQALDEADRRGPGSVRWDPNFVFPDYFKDVEFHIQPGNYHADPLAGYLYYYGTKVFFYGANNNDEAHVAQVNSIPLPPDGRVHRVLDVACSSGQSATALKQRFPNAEVWGIDVGAPMVRFSHLRAADMGLDIHFKQAAAEATGFPDNYFDMVYVFLLFHEVPVSSYQEILRELRRITRPGGIVAIKDIVNRDNPAFGPPSPITDVTWDHNREDIGEPYQYDFYMADFTRAMQDAGLTVTSENVMREGFTPMRIGLK